MATASNFSVCYFLINVGGMILRAGQELVKRKANGRKFHIRVGVALTMLVKAGESRQAFLCC